MKKVISITISLCLIFCAVVPVFGVTEVTNPAWNTWFQSINNNVTSIKTYTQSFVDSWVTFFETMTGGTPSTLLTFQDLVRDVLRIGDWLAPIASYTDGLRPSALLSVWDTLQSTLSTLQLNTSYNAQSMADLDELRKANTNFDYRYYNRQLTTIEASNLAHRDLFGATADYPTTPWYTVPNINNGGLTSNTSRNWFYGTPIGNIATLLRNILINDSRIYQFRWAADLTHYNDTLTTWDSQGNTLTQVTFTPESAIQGLYRYLAFTQRDVARLSYVFSNNAELQAREYAQGAQTTVTSLFINPDSDSSAKQSDFSSMSSQSELARDNFFTGYNAYDVWGGFNPSIYSGTDGWFTQTTANNLDTSTSVASVRSTKSIQPVILEDYPTPLLDAYYEEIYSLQGDLND